MRFSQAVLKPFTQKKRNRKSQSTKLTTHRRKSAKKFKLFARLHQKPIATEKQIIKVPIEAPAVQPLRVEPIVQNQSGLLLSSIIHPGKELKESMDGFLFNQRSEHTQRAYNKDIQRFIKFLIVRKAQIGDEALTRNHFIAYKSWLLNEKLEHTTIDRHLATLRSLFQWLEEDGFIQKNPVSQVRFLKPRKLSTTEGFTDEEVRRILSLPNLHTRTGSQHYAILMILFYCGLRRSELCELRTSHLGLEESQRIMRLRGKGNKERIIPIIKQVWNAIQYFMMITRKFPGDDQYLFSPIRNNRTGIKEKALDPTMIYYIVTKYARMAGITKKVSPHSCRATAISNARDQQVSDRAIQEFAGWSSPDMITRYDKRKSAIRDSAAHQINYGKEDRSLPQWMISDSEILYVSSED